MKVSSTISPGLDENPYKGPLFARHQKGKTIRLDSLVMVSAKSKENSSLFPCRFERILGENIPDAKKIGVTHEIRAPMDEGTIKTPNPKCRLYRCLIEFIDWRYSQLCLYFDPSCELFPLYLLSDLPRPFSPSQSKCSVWLGGCLVVL
jgi:hypothetical protein